MLGTVSGPEQIGVGVAVGLIVIVMPLLARFLVGLSKDVHELKVAVVGEEATKYHPRRPGLVEIVADMQRTVGATLTGTAALVKDSKPDEGSTSRDALDRIEIEQDRLRNLTR